MISRNFLAGSYTVYSLVAHRWFSIFGPSFSPYDRCKSTLNTAYHPYHHSVDWLPVHPVHNTFGIVTFNWGKTAVIGFKNLDIWFEQILLPSAPNNAVNRTAE